MCGTQNVASAESTGMRAGRWTWLFWRVGVSDNKKGKIISPKIFGFASFFFDFCFFAAYVRSRVNFEEYHGSA